MIKDEVLDKIRGGWFGKCLGGAAGAMMEGVKNPEHYVDFKDIYNSDLPNDDLDLQLLWLEALEEKGMELTQDDMAEKWRRQCWYPFSEYGQFLYNYERGITPPLSGVYNNQFYKNGMGCPIRSEIWAFAFAGDPNKAVKYAKMDGSLDHGGEAVLAEMYMAAVESLAFNNISLLELLYRGMDYLPLECELKRMLHSIFALYHKNISIESIKKEIIRTYGHLDFTNCLQNMAFVVISLLYGELNLEKTINLALNLGYDTDCTCGNAAAILGTVLGYQAIPMDLKQLMKDQFVCGIDVKRSSDKISDLSSDTYRLYQRLKTDQRQPLSIEIDYNNHPYIRKGESVSYHIVKFDQLTDLKVTQLEGNVNCVLDQVSGELTFIAPSDFVYEKNTFILSAKIGTHQVAKTIGIAGLPVYLGKGIFFEQADYPYNENHPYCHGEGCVLPSVENMVNNKVDLYRQYISEEFFDQEFEEYDFKIYCKDEFIPYEEEIKYKGQMCFYLQTTIFSPLSQDIWLVLQNTDGFMVWINGKKVITKDEVRCYTPVNNCEIVHLKEGKNILTIKLIRRTDVMKFALAFYEYNGKHFHQTKHVTNLGYL